MHNNIHLNAMFSMQMHLKTMVIQLQYMVMSM